MTFTTQTAFFAEPFLFPTSAQYSEAKGNQHVNDRIYHKECAGKNLDVFFKVQGMSMLDVVLLITSCLRHSLS